MNRVNHVKEDELWWNLPQFPFFSVELPTSMAQCWW